MCPNVIFFLLHPNYDLVLACFSLACNPGASHIAFHMEFEKRAVLSPPLKLPGVKIPVTPVSRFVNSK